MLESTLVFISQLEPESWYVGKNSKMEENIDELLAESQASI